MSNRADMIGNPGVYLERSPTGSGKSHGDTEAVKHPLVRSALVVVPTHENCSEVVEDMQKAGVDAMAYPGLTTKGKNQNCENGGSADLAKGMGLSVVEAVCPSCPYLRECLQTGYRGQLVSVQSAKVAVSTAQRAVYNGIDKLSTGRHDYIVMHEEAAGTLCPDATASLSDLERVDEVLNLILNDPKYLDWLGQSASKDEDGQWVPNEKLAERRDGIDQFIRNLCEVVECLISALKTATKTRAIELPKPVKKPAGVGGLLLRATLEAEVNFSAEPYRLLLAAAAGELYSIGVIVDATPGALTKTALTGMWRNIPSENAVVLFCDATATKEDLESYLGRPVTDITPTGHLERSKRAVQSPKDVTRRTKANRFLAVIRGAMSEFAESQRVGIITHRTLVGYLPKIGEPFASRIVKSTYFGSGQDRASNDWYKQCDLIIVAGTPRVASVAIQQRIIQFGEFAAASENPDWGEVRWRGHTETGDEQIVTNRGYRHPIWNRAHRSMVRSAIVQAAGRGRSLLETGCDVLVISTEECGLPLLSQDAEIIAENELKLLSHLKELSAQKLTSENLSAPYAYNISKATVPIKNDLASLVPISSTNDIALAIGLKERRTRYILSNLESRKLIVRSGERGGWVLTKAGLRLLETSPSLVETGGKPA